MGPAVLLMRDDFAKVLDQLENDNWKDRFVAASKHMRDAFAKHYLNLGKVCSGENLGVTLAETATIATGVGLTVAATNAARQAVTTPYPNGLFSLSRNGAASQMLFGYGTTLGKAIIYAAMGPALPMGAMAGSWVASKLRGMCRSSGDAVGGPGDGQARQEDIEAGPRRPDALDMQEFREGATRQRRLEQVAPGPQPALTEGSFVARDVTLVPKMEMFRNQLRDRILARYLPSDASINASGTGAAASNVGQKMSQYETSESRHVIVDASGDVHWVDDATMLIRPLPLRSEGGMDRGMDRGMVTPKGPPIDDRLQIEIEKSHALALKSQRKAAEKMTHRTTPQESPTGPHDAQGSPQPPREKDGKKEV
jgi:hypothetical protein